MKPFDRHNHTSRKLAIIMLAVLLVLILNTFVPLLNFNQILKHSSAASAWVNGSYYPTNISNEACVENSGYIYCTGGYTGSIYVSNSYFGSVTGIHANTTGQWTATTAYPFTIDNLACVALSGYMVCGTGLKSGTTVTNNFFTAPMLGGSGLGAWTNTTTFPVALAYIQCVVDPVYSAIYCGNGQDGSSNAQTGWYSATISVGGLLSSWHTLTSFPIATRLNACAELNAYIYCMAGIQGGSFSSESYSAPITSASSIGAWNAQGGGHGSPAIIQSCSANTGAPTQSKLNCSFGSSVTSGDLIVGIVTCEGCGAGASPIINDSSNNVYHFIAQTFGVAQAGAIMVANISSSGALSVSGQIRDSFPRSYWAFSAYEVNSSQTTNLIAKYFSSVGTFSGGQPNVNVVSLSWNTSVIAFEGADVDGFSPPCTTGFVTGVSSTDNTHCNNVGYSNSNSPSTFTMGTGGTAFGELVVLLPYFAPAMGTGNGYPFGSIQMSCVSQARSVYCIGGEDSNSIVHRNVYFNIPTAGVFNSWVSYSPYPDSAGFLQASCVADATTITCIGNGASGTNKEVWWTLTGTTPSGNGNIVQDVCSSFTGNVNAFSVMMPSPVSTGDYLAAFVDQFAQSHGSVDPFSVIDILGNTFTQVNSTSTGETNGSIWLTTIINSGSDTVTVQPSGFGFARNPVVCVYELQGLNGLYATGTNSGINSQLVSLSSPVATTVGGLVIAMGSEQAACATGTWTPTASYTLVGANLLVGGVSEYQFTNVGTTTAPMTFTGNTCSGDNSWAETLISFGVGQVTPPTIIRQSSTGNSTGLTDFCTFTNVVATGDIVLVTVGNTGAQTFIAQDTALLNWTLLAQNTEVTNPNDVSSVVFGTIAPFPLAGETITVVMGGNQTDNIHTFMHCLDILDPAVTDINPSDGQVVAVANGNTSPSSLVTSVHGFSGPPSYAISIMAYSKTAQVQSPSGWFNPISAPNSPLQYSDSQFQSLKGFASDASYVANRSSNYGWSECAVALVLPTVIQTITVTSTVAASAGSTITNIWSPIGFDYNNVSTYVELQASTQIVYVWLNAAPYPITLNWIAVPVLQTGGNGSFFIIGLFTTNNLNQTINGCGNGCFQQQAIKTYQAVPFAVNQMFNFTDLGWSIPANTYFSINILDANATTQTPCYGYPASAGIGPHGNICPISPFIFYGGKNMTGGYYGTFTLNQNITGNNPQAVMPNFFADNQLISRSGPIPVMFVSETDNPTRVITTTRTNTETVGVAMAAFNNIFNNTQALGGLLLIIVPLMLLGWGNTGSGKPIDPRIVFGLLLIILAIGVTTKLIPYWMVLFSSLIFIMVYLRKGRRGGIQ